MTKMSAKSVPRTPRKSKLPVDVDQVVVCAGQVEVTDLVGELEMSGIDVTVVGGASKAAELDAKRAIRQGAEAAARL